MFTLSCLPLSKYWEGSTYPLLMLFAKYLYQDVYFISYSSIQVLRRFNYYLSTTNVLR